ncbi:MAG: aminoacyl-tRNA hydrolase [Candidatus Wildermuthbacteria bacterium]|nr:aminoacyl-tRNA hydrolase [Candidatus Wildermuthbacteria bacterium]
MLFIVGLGNPGKKYEKTRHNAGFRAIDAIAANFQFSIFNFQSIFNAQISKGKITDKQIILAKPQTLMNNSGSAVQKITKNYKLKTTNLIVIHDDIDIPLGKIKVSKGSGSAGHKGVESIIQALGTKDFTRIRIGILPPEGKPEDVENFVLKPFKKEELPLLTTAIDLALSTLISKLG